MKLNTSTACLIGFICPVIASVSVNATPNIAETELPQINSSLIAGCGGGGGNSQGKRAEKEAMQQELKRMIEERKNQEASEDSSDD